MTIQTLYRYDKLTGDLFYLHSTKPPQITKHRLGYLVLNHDGERHYVHNIAWLLMTGKPPIGKILHIDGNRSNNRWTNLTMRNKTT